MSEQNAPFITLGRHLKYVREQLQESVAEVSGAVEIDEQTLENIEAGEERPAEDILLLLISHYNLQDQQAVQLWELAEYDSDTPDQIKPSAMPIDGKSVVMLLALDTRTMYSDGIEVTVDKAGLTLNFTQAMGKAQHSSVGRIGMSLEQAEEVTKALHLALLKARYDASSKLQPPNSAPT